MPDFFPSTQSDPLVSLSHGKYDDLRMPWVGRKQGPRVVTVTDAGVILAEMNEDRVWISIQNNGNNEVYINLGEIPAVLDSSLFLGAKPSSIVFDRSMPWPDRITAITRAGITAVVLICEVSQNVRSGRGE